MLPIQVVLTLDLFHLLIRCVILQCFPRKFAYAYMHVSADMHKCGPELMVDAIPDLLSSENDEQEVAGLVAVSNMS